MKKKLYGTITLLIIVALICSLLTLFLRPKEQEWKWYENEERGFKVKYPLGWKADSSDGEGTSHCFTFIGNPKTSLPLLEIEVAKTSETLEFIEKDLNEQRECYKESPTYHLSEIRLCTFHGRKALEWNITDTFFEEMQHSLVTKNENLAYKISFKNNLSDWDQHWEKMIEEIKESWEFL
jgi:hypothetical protein